MTALLALALLAPAPTVVAERGAEPGRFAVAVAGFGTREEAAAAGLRHLVEHLAVLGPGRDADARLEAAGAFLEAETGRSHVLLAASGPVAAFPLALEVLAECVGGFRATPEEVAREARLIAEEDALRSPAQRHAAAAWLAAYGLPDPVGDGDSLAGADPAALARLHAQTFRAGSLVVCCVGDFDPADAEAQARAAFARVPDAEAPLGAFPEARLGAAGSAPAPGSARAAPFVPAGKGGSLAVLAAGLAVRREIPGVQLLATLGVDPGVATLWAPRPAWAELDRDAPGLAARSAAAAREELAQWLAPAGCLARAKAWAQLGGGTGVRSPASLAALARGLSVDEVARAAEAFAEPLAVQVRGS